MGQFEIVCHPSPWRSDAGVLALDRIGGAVYALAIVPTGAMAVNRRDLQRALPDLGRSARVPGLEGRVEVWRDAQGISHIRAHSVHDAFPAQGFVHAQDRLWHMAYDRPMRHDWDRVRREATHQTLEPERA